MSAGKSYATKKKTPADLLEERARAEYIPSQIIETLSKILAIETYALWCSDADGRADVMKENEYTDDELNKVLEKQAVQAARLRVKVDFLKRLYNTQARKRA